MMCPDHPRSRGVYTKEIHYSLNRMGSSPLARGLPLWVMVGAFILGIIPARAGFTADDRPRSERSTDHPRSRGVYVFGIAVVSPVIGSSPLARGLRLADAYFRRDRRIIPARAGFTSFARSPHPSSPDHPRSRGVYTCACMTRCPRVGSSPLARGLHEQLTLI